MVASGRRLPYWRRDWLRVVVDDHRHLVHEPVLAANEPFFGVGDEALAHPSGIFEFAAAMQDPPVPAANGGTGFRASYAQPLALARPRFCAATLVLVAATFEATADASIAPILIILRRVRFCFGLDALFLMDWPLLQDREPCADY